MGRARSVFGLLTLALGVAAASVPAHSQLASAPPAVSAIVAQTEAEKAERDKSLAEADKKLLELLTSAEKNLAMSQQTASWIGLLLGRTKDDIDRRRWEAEMSVLAPEFSMKEIALLDRWEVNTDHLENKPSVAHWNKTGLPEMVLHKPGLRHGKVHFYSPVGVLPKNPKTGRNIGSDVPELFINEKLPLPILRMDEVDTDRPVVNLSFSKRDREILRNTRKKISYFYEFDVDESFNTKKVWRYPSLMPTTAVANLDPTHLNLTTTEGLTYYVFLSTLRNPSNSARFKLPFRVTSMAYQQSETTASFSDLAKTALLLQHGLEPQDAIREVYQFTRNNYVWGSNSLILTPIDVFRARVAGCGAINDLAGAMLEMNGIRYRGIGGFHPLNRIWYPGGGHSAIEVFDGSKWSFFDAFLDLYSPRVPAADFEKSKVGRQIIGGFGSAVPADPSGVLGSNFPNGFLLKDLFKYRVYGDIAARMPMGHMMRLKGGGARVGLGHLSEATYGTTWPIRTHDVKFDPLKDVPEVQRIHVRARYIISDCQVSGYQVGKKCSDEKAQASEWVRASFDTFPRELLTREPGQLKMTRAVSAAQK